MSQMPQPPADDPVWHFMVGPQTVGPLTMQAVLAMIQSGGIQSSTMVWREGMPNWTPAGAVPEFSFALSSTSSKKEIAMGLNTAGLVVFIVLLCVCLPLCWLPWVIDSLKAPKA